MSDKKSFPPYEEALKRVQEKGIKTEREYEKYFKELGLPSSPRKSYKNSWISWDIFLGKRQFPTYEEAKLIVKTKCFKGLEEYKLYCKELGLPSHPEDYYDTNWVDWPTFLGKSYPFPTYEEAQGMVQANGIKTKTEYMSFYKVHGLPSDPNCTYKDSWIDWASFLGKSKRISSEERKTRLLTKLGIHPTLLKEDTPLQIIYILASQLDKTLATEIENLLGTTSYEERLNWVKEQLRNIKEGSSSVSKHTPDDELSVMESIIKDFDTDSLPERDKLNLNTIIENYIHNAVNKEIITDYDG